MKIKLISFSFVFFIFFEPSQAQNIYDIKDCIRTGLEKNFSLLITRNSETISKNNYTIGNAGFLPSIDLGGKHSATLNNTIENMKDGSRSTSDGVYNTTNNAEISMDLTIFNGFSVQTTYKKLNELKIIGELNTQMAIETLIADLVSGYYNYIQQVQLLKNMKYAVILSKERLRIDEDRYLLGSSSKLQVLQSRVYLNADSSRLSRQFEVVRAAQIRLNEMMALEDLGQLFISKDTSIEVIQDLLYEKLLKETLARNTGLQIASKDKTISEVDYKLITSRSYPYLNMSSGYSYNQNTYSASTTKNKYVNGMNYDLTIGINIFDGMNQRRSIRNSSIEVKNKELRYLEIEQGLKADLLTLYSAYSNYLRLINLEQQNLQTATENLNIAMERYKLGNLSGIDLREVQMSLLNARESLLSVKYQTKNAEILLLLISGRIMDYYK
ncbi:MAG: TolC family protein [Bacteroidales bacterium]|jgi:outer membrane protein TolC|nr:TolC family protein [Bacteroidales bacterium]